MPRGDCYEAAVKYMTEHGTLGPSFMRHGEEGRNLLLVHGEVAGQGPLHGKRYGHAWIEDGNKVFDPSNDHLLTMPMDAYYALGRIAPPFTRKPANLHRYTASEVRKKLIETRHYGPWDLKTSSGL